jgi:phage gpG-like protein
MTTQQYQQYLKDLEGKFKKFTSTYAPAIAGNVAVRLFKKNFREEGFFGKKWKEVQRRTEGARAYKAVSRHHPSDNSRKILTGRTGDLGRSIEVKEAGSGRATVWTDPAAFSGGTAYGSVHNEGLRSGRGKGFTMPRRQFAGDHPELRDEIARELEKKLNDFLNS